MTTIKKLIQEGLLCEGDELVWSRRVQKITHIAHITAEGSIKTSDGNLHKTPSGAAKHLNANKPVDGWIAWKSRKNGKSLNDLRNQVS